MKSTGVVFDGCLLQQLMLGERAIHVLRRSTRSGLSKCGPLENTTGEIDLTQLRQRELGYAVPSVGPMIDKSFATRVLSASRTGMGLI